MLRLVTLCSLAFGLAIGVGPVDAEAGAPSSTVHPIQIKGKLLTDEEEDGKVEKTGLRNKEIQEICCGEASKDNDLFVEILDCDPSFDTTIQVRNKKTGAIVKTVGGIGNVSALNEEKNGELKKQVGRAQLNLNCEGIGAFAFGNVEIRYDKDGCVQKIRFDGVGDGFDGEFFFIVEQLKARVGKDESDEFTPEP